MVSRSDVAAALQHLASQHALESLELDERDSAVIEFGEDLAIIFEFSEADGSLTMWSPLCSLEIADTFEDELKLLKALLGLNFPASRLSGARVALNEDLGVVLLAKEVLLPPGQPEILAQHAQKFAQFVEQLIGQLKDGSLPGEETPLNLAPPAAPESFIRA